MADLRFKPPTGLLEILMAEPEHDEDEDEDVDDIFKKTQEKNNSNLSYLIKNVEFYDKDEDDDDDDKDDTKTIMRMRHKFKKTLKKNDSDISHIIENVKHIEFHGRTFVLSDMIAKKLAEKAKVVETVCVNIPNIESHGDSFCYVIPECREFCIKCDKSMLETYGTKALHHLFETMPATVDKITLRADFSIPVLNLSNLPPTVKVIKILCRIKPNEKSYARILEKYKEKGLPDSCEFVCEKFM